MEKITEKEAMKLLKEFDIEEMIDINIEDYYWVKDMYPKAWELIQKLDNTIKYVNVDDMQGSNFAVGLCGTARAWALHICHWADSDDYEDDYEDVEDADDWRMTYLCPLLGYFKTEEDTLDLISEIWSLDIRELCTENKLYQKAEDDYKKLCEEVNNSNLTLEQLCDKLNGHNLGDDLFDVNYGTICATVIQQDGKIKVQDNIEIWDDKACEMVEANYKAIKFEEEDE